MRAPKYILWMDHISGYGNLDKKVRLNATNLLDAIKESGNITASDSYLYCVCLFEKEYKGNQYSQIMRSSNGKDFHIEGNDFCHLVRNVTKVGGNVVESFDFH